MRQWIFLLGALLSTTPAVAEQAVVEVEVEIKNMSCPVCARTISERLRATPGVAKAEVSLKHKKATVVLAPGQAPDPARLKQVIAEAGFEAGETTVRRQP